MRVVLQLFCLVGLSLIASVTANAQQIRDYWVTHSDSGPNGLVMHFVDTASATEGSRPNSLRYWSTDVFQSPWQLTNLGTVRSMVTLIEVDCRTSEFRAIQSTAFARGGSPLHTMSEPTDWTFATPETTIAYTTVLVCTGRNAPNSPWVNYGNMNALEQAERFFDAIGAQ